MVNSSPGDWISNANTEKIRLELDCLQSITRMHMNMQVQCIRTVNRKYFVVKYFWTAWLVRKLTHENINDNAVQDRLSENYLT